jgi:hypothetical protein
MMPTLRKILLGVGLLSLGTLATACHKNKGSSTMENKGGDDMSSHEGMGDGMGYGGMDPCEGKGDMEGMDPCEGGE